MTKINSKKRAKDISTYDFSTSYTKLSHDELIKNLNHIIVFRSKEEMIRKTEIVNI